MILVGFIKEYDPIAEAVALDELINNPLEIDKDIKKIITYLSGGELVLGLMGYFVDFKTNQKIDPMGYYTDGIWVWPSYIVYYLKKYPHMSLDLAFISHVKSNNFKMSIDKKFKYQKNKEHIFEEELEKRLFTEFKIYDIRDIDYDAIRGISKKNLHEL
jgi:hypothetical protein